MFRMTAIVLFLFTSLVCFAQAPLLAPELHWWLAEAQKANKDIGLEGFRLRGTEKFSVKNERSDKAGLYPVFMRWNYSASRVGYFELGAELGKRGEKYRLSRDIDSSVLILDPAFTVLHLDSHGSSSRIGAIAWLRDDLMQGVGIELNFSDKNRTMIDLVIKLYAIGKTQVSVSTFVYKNAFANDRWSDLKLNWTQWRPDYFTEGGN